jgi:hypothetical protein
MGPIKYLRVPLLVGVYVLGFLGIVASGGSDDENGGTTDVPIGGSISGFGPTYYRGQTFIALSGIAEKLTVYVGESNSIPGPVTYHVLITEIDSTGGINPTNVLFESGPLVTNIGNAVNPPAVTVDLGGLSLTAGEKYAWILDAYVELDNNPPVNPGGPYPSALVGLNDIFVDNFPEIEQLSWSLGPFPTGTREEHFNNFWGPGPKDLAFTMTFSEVVKIIAIDIKHGSDTNSVNPKSKVVIPVAVLGSTDFDAMQVDLTKVAFGPGGAKPAHNGHVEDVNEDGFMDMMFHFRTQESEIICGDTEATLTGELYDGTQVAGTDTVNTVGCKDNSNSAGKVDDTTSSSAGAVS